MATEKNHYIPEFYLKSWTNDRGQLCEFSRPYRDVAPRRISPGGTGYMKGLYTVSGLPSEAAHWLEDTFLIIADGTASVALKHLLDDNVDALNGDLKSAWSRFIISLWNRTPEKIAWLKDRWEEHNTKIAPIVQARFEKSRQEGNPMTYEEYKNGPDKEAAGRLLVRVMQSVMDLKNVGQHLNNMRWSIMTVKGNPEPLLTSDRPVVKPLPLKEEDAHIIMPLSPTKLFVAANADATLRIIQSNGPRFNVVRTNNLVCRQAAKYVYGNDDGMLSYVERRLGHDPEAQHMATFHKRDP
jgi:hypothetical protein